ncbi:UNVERIFIED_CONTAM: hypothetical protein K2H54_048026 [Gekko kuhli]
MPQFFTVGEVLERHPVLPRRLRKQPGTAPGASLEAFQAPVATKQLIRRQGYLVAMDAALSLPIGWLWCYDNTVDRQVLASSVVNTERSSFSLIPGNRIPLPRCLSRQNCAGLCTVQCRRTVSQHSSPPFWRESLAGPTVFSVSVVTMPGCLKGSLSPSCLAWSRALPLLLPQP